MQKTLPKFNNQALLDQAYTHRSYLNENPKQHLVSNERLEFLGDSILSFVTSLYLYQHFTELPEGDLTNLRSLLVQARTLAEASRELELGKHLKLSRGEEESGGRENNSLLANTYEAFLGALYLDQGIDAASTFVHETLLIKVPEIVERGSFKDDKSLLQELVQEKKFPAPTYKLLKAEGPDHAKVFTVGVYINNELAAEASGRSKNEAEKEAARRALEVWKKK